MKKEKRTFPAETILANSLRLEPESLESEKSTGSLNPIEKKTLSISPDLIARLTERIKKL